MKLVIQTQIKENYGAHDWDGKGECPQYWKFKGGNSYVVEGLTGKQINKIGQQGIPTLTALIEESNESWQEYILDWEIVEDDATVCEAWEAPIVMSYVDGEWTAREVTENGEYGYFRSEIVRQIRTWTMLKGGETENNTCSYVMDDGSELLHKDLAQWFEDQKEVA
jgi:hypothetical protein